MRNILILGFTLFCSITYAQQDNRFSVSWGYGYFADVMQLLYPGFGAVPDWAKVNPKVYGKVFSGSNLLVNTSMRLNTGYDINFGLIKATTNYYFNDPLGVFWDAPKRDNYFMLYIGFSRNLLNEKSRFAVVPGLNLIYRIYNSPSIDYNMRFNTQDGVEYLVPSFPVHFNIREMHDAGLMFSNEIMFRLSNTPIELGLKAYTYILLGIGVEAVSVLPLIKFNF